MKTKIILNNISKNLYHKNFKNLKEQELKDLAVKLNIPLDI